MTIAVIMINTDWAKKNQRAGAQLLRRLMRGVRDYCQAYHGGSIRQALIDLLIRTGTETRPELLHKYPWPARSLDGQINIASMLDIQTWYVQNKLNAAVSGRAPGRQQLRRVRHREARTVRAGEQGQQGSRGCR